MIDLQNKKVIYFDGVCNLCTGTVQFLLRHNKKEDILFSSLQSKSGLQMLRYFGLPQHNYSSFVFVENGVLYQQSTGALRVTRYLGGLWPLLYVLILVPPCIRNRVYNKIAKNRYKWFGKKGECWLPTPAFKKRFLDE
jgi:predicted DCC family thiol-disulfide oxidoreductase YuxK